MKDNRIFKKPNLLTMTPEEAKEAILILEEGYSNKTLKERMEAEEDYIPENLFHYIAIILIKQTINY